MFSISFVSLTMFITNRLEIWLEFFAWAWLLACTSYEQIFHGTIPQPGWKYGLRVLLTVFTHTHTLPTIRLGWPSSSCWSSFLLSPFITFSCWLLIGLYHFYLLQHVGGRVPQLTWVGWGNWVHVNHPFFNGHTHRYLCHVKDIFPTHWIVIVTKHHLQHYSSSWSTSPYQASCCAQTLAL